MLQVSPRLVLPDSEIRLSFVRSSGPGGQNVNKVNSKVQLTWNLEASPSVPGPIKARFRRAYRARINRAGELILTSQKHRQQSRNVDECREKLRTMLAAVEFPPKRRVVTKPTGSSKRRRLDNKKHRSSQKRLRRNPNELD